MKIGVATVAQLTDFDQIIDVRTPAEFAEDHVPGAINCPVLDDNQRIEVGTLYKQVSPFAARRVGAAYAAEAIGRHIRERFLDKPKHWRPLIMCWRGGQRSGSMVTVLRAVGWDACQLEGGYKAFRAKVMTELTELPQRFQWRVITGPTGSAKTHILQALVRQGAQALDLETLACHKGSVLGADPIEAQPGQNKFETQLWLALQGFKAEQPVWVEAESRKIGRVHIPDQLIAAIRCAEVFAVTAPLEARVRFLMSEYGHFLAEPEKLKECLNALRALRGNETIKRWQTWIDQGLFPELVAALLNEHYDPAYHSSQSRNFTQLDEGHILKADTLDPPAISALAQQAVSRTVPGS